MHWAVQNKYMAVDTNAEQVKTWYFPDALSNCAVCVKGVKMLPSKVSSTTASPLAPAATLAVLADGRKLQPCIIPKSAAKGGAAMRCQWKGWMTP